MTLFFKGSVLSLLVGMSLVVQALPAQAPVCNEAAIATYKQEIVQRERANLLVRSAVYVCAASAVAYVGYKVFFSAQPPVAQSELVSAVEKVAGDVDLLKKRAGLEGQESRISVRKMLARPFWKTAGGFFRDMFIQTVAMMGLSKVSERVGQYAFYDYSLHIFIVRATSLGRIFGDIDGYAGMLTTPGYGDAQLIPIKELLITRCADLCATVEHMVAYMRYLEDSVSDQSRGALVVAENYLVDRSNNALASLWLSLSKDKPEEISSGIMLSLQLFQVDVQQACNRFDNAYVGAQVAAVKAK